MSVENATKLMQDLAGALGTEYSTMVQRNIDLVNRMKSLSGRHQAIIEQFHSNLNMIESGIMAVEQFSIGANNKVMQIDASPNGVDQSNRKSRPRLGD